MTGCSGGVIMNTFVFTYWAPNRNSRVGTAWRWRATIAAGPNVNAWLGHTVAHIGRSPIDVRS